MYKPLIIKVIIRIKESLKGLGTEIYNNYYKFAIL